MWAFVRRVLAIAEKEVRHVTRDPRTLIMAFAMPVAMLLLFGYGMSFDLDNLQVAVMDQDQSESSRAMTRRLVANDDFSLVRSLDDLDDAKVALVAGDALAVLIIERDFERDLNRGRDVQLGLWLDGSDANSALQARAKAEAVVSTAAAEAAAGARINSPLPIEVRTFTRFNPQGLSAVFLVPGITAYLLAIVAVLLTALTVAREWEQGSMAQLFATPVSRLEIVVGKLLPYLVLGSLTVLLVLAVGSWVFNVPFRGSALALALLSFLFLAGMLGQGLLISVLARNQMVATQAATLSSMLPSLLLSGVLFPIANMPAPLRAVSRIIPARYYVEGLRGILLRGNGVEHVWRQAVALLIFAAVMLVLSTLRFRRTVA
ncbi:MAG: ABC transporter permease [Myxococcales bacterium]|nr:ABC transporter permease [Myxococcales bacterium]